MNSFELYYSLAFCVSLLLSSQALIWKAACLCRHSTILKLDYVCLNCIWWLNVPSSLTLLSLYQLLSWFWELPLPALDFSHLRSLSTLLLGSSFKIIIPAAVIHTSCSLISTTSVTGSYFKVSITLTNALIILALPLPVMSIEFSCFLLKHFPTFIQAVLIVFIDFLISHYIWQTHP